MAAPWGKVPDSVPLTTQHPVCGKQALYTNRTACMDSACADTHLCTKTKSVAISKSCAGIVEDTGTVHTVHEMLSCLLCEWREENQQ